MDIKTPTNRQGRGSVAVCGNPIGSQIIALLLRDSGYQARSLPSTSSLYETGVLEGVQLILLTPTPELDAEHRRALLASLKDIRGDAELTFMELVTPSAQEGRKEAEKDEAWHKVPWPCRFKELERRIEEALLSEAR
jgi:hypothetical protein